MLPRCLQHCIHRSGVRIAGHCCLGELFHLFLLAQMAGPGDLKDCRLRIPSPTQRLLFAIWSGAFFVSLSSGDGALASIHQAANTGRGPSAQTTNFRMEYTSLPRHLSTLVEDGHPPSDSALGDSTTSGTGSEPTLESVDKPSSEGTLPSVMNQAASDAMDAINSVTQKLVDMGLEPWQIALIAIGAGLAVLCIVCCLLRCLCKNLCCCCSKD
ncbi:transmembrane protein [Cystoisospora suis]|uniref:Transmembrane protein n=1 Tax=Cystoisospora suis TaxID=483139 RepID=A0A2C6L6C8_9APIC|nr:transmembrane protein [Cystoisospora suis]